MGNIFTDCTALEPSILTLDDGEVKIILCVHLALVHDTLGANVSGFMQGDQIVMTSLRKAKGLEPLSWRYRNDVRAVWPPSYRFQVPRENLMAEVLSRDNRITRCVVQVPQVATERTMDNAQLHLQDAEIATARATGFNEMSQQQKGNMMDFRDQGEAPPTVKVCAPVACEVLSSSAPEILPRGAACTVTPYPHSEVIKFVFDGADEFLEVPQAFFHFAAFASGGTEQVCDIQGMEDDNGGIHLLDPVVLRQDTANVQQFLSTFTAAQKPDPAKKFGPDHAPTDERFDRLHPRCGQMCQSFDPMRRGAKGKKGYCGITCMQ